MAKKKKIIIIVAVLLFALVLSVAIPISRMSFRPYGRQEVLTPEHAIQIAKAAIIQRYGEAEIEGMEFRATDMTDFNLPYWEVIEDKEGAMMGYWPVVYVRRTDGMVFLLWRNNAIHRLGLRLLTG